MQKARLDAVVIGDTPHVYYFSAYRPFWLHQVGFVLFADGTSVLIAPNSPPSDPVAADNVVTYEANRFSTLVQEQPANIASKAIEVLAGKAKSIGIDASAVTSQLALRHDGKYTAIDEPLWQMRRRKDLDELALMRKAIACSEAMYARAKEIIEPGISEIEVFAELYSAAVKVAGEPLSALLGNDYRCGAGGGPPRGGRLAKAGELYILDLGPAYRGYFSDSCRAFSVDRNPTEAQLAACEAVKGVLQVVERMAKPGARCVEIFEAASQHLRSIRGKGMTHHLGHGVGLQPHEYPHLNPQWDDTLVEGEIFTAEPGVYGPELAGGIRLENEYLVTKTGVENLLNFSLELV